jgi:hypothetical protein
LEFVEDEVDVDEVDERGDASEENVESAGVAS